LTTGETSANWEIQGIIFPLHSKTLLCHNHLDRDSLGFIERQLIFPAIVELGRLADSWQAAAGAVVARWTERFSTSRHAWTRAAPFGGSQ
jgi:hypothetical protein